MYCTVQVVGSLLLYSFDCSRMDIRLAFNQVYGQLIGCEEI